MDRMERGEQGRTLLHGGTVIDPANGVEGQFDVLIEDNVIADVVSAGQIAKDACERSVEVAGKWVVPGLIDLHVHLREPGFEWKETVATGCRSAVAGGYTSICCMPNTKPANDSEEVTRYILEKAEACGLARVLPIGAVSVGLKGTCMAPLSELAKAGCVAFSDDGEPVYDSGLMRRALEWAAMLDLVVSCHEEDKCLSCGGVMNESPLSMRLGLKGFPKVAEEVMVARDIELARTTGGRVHICHISSGRTAELIRRAKADGIRITAEVTPHHLMLTEEAVAEYDCNAKMSPPLREAAECEALIAALADGTIDAVASDHAPHERDTKEVAFSEASFGILGLQTSLPLLLELVRNGSLSRSRAIEAAAAGPAKVFGLEGGSLKRGAPADVTVIDPHFSWRFDREALHSKSINSPFLGRDLVGAADRVFVRGREVIKGRVLLEDEQ